MIHISRYNLHYFTHKPLASKIEVIRESADKLWEHGWLQGHPPGEPINLDDMLDNDEDSD